MRPNDTDYATYYQRYVGLVEGDDVLGALEQQSASTQKLLSALDDTRAAHRYAEGKWSIREVIGHVCDAERVFAYRAMCIARGEQQPLPGFDENEFMANAAYDAWKIGELAENFALIRRSTILLLRNLPADAWERRGTASGNPVTVNALAWIMAGHEAHHVNVLRERYGV
jgi:uncharacterized damage-inducible protein DinB